MSPSPCVATFATEKPALMMELSIVTNAHIQKTRESFLARIILPQYHMKTRDTSTLFLTTGFLLSKIGKEITEGFAERIAPLGLRPKHCGLLAALQALPPMSQQELGRALGLVPSAIVTSLDELKALHAIARVEDLKDRRRYTIELTARGETLLRKATQLAVDIDNEMMATLSKAERVVLNRSLQGIAGAIGVIPDMTRTSLS